jgi:hypothetical protein
MFIEEDMLNKELGARGLRECISWKASYVLSLL